jgi:hypothetical protein
MTTFSTHHLHGHPFQSIALQASAASTPSTQLQNQMMEHVIQAARSLLSSAPRQRRHANIMNPSSETCTKMPDDSWSQATYSTPTPPRRKAAEKQHDAEDEPSRDDDDKDKMQDNGQSPGGRERESRGLACPFFRRNPRGHLYHPEGQECLNGWSTYSHVR